MFDVLKKVGKYVIKYTTYILSFIFLQMSNFVRTVILYNYQNNCIYYACSNASTGATRGLCQPFREGLTTVTTSPPSSSGPGGFGISWPGVPGR